MPVDGRADRLGSAPSTIWWPYVSLLSWILYSVDGVYDIFLVRILRMNV